MSAWRVLLLLLLLVWSKEEAHASPVAPEPIIAIRIIDSCVAVPLVVDNVAALWMSCLVAAAVDAGFILMRRLFALQTANSVTIYQGCTS